MRLVLLVVISTIIGLAAWASIVVWGTFNGLWRDPIAPAGDNTAFTQAIVTAINTNYHGNVAFALIDDGHLYSEHFASVGDPINRDTLFQVASMSKWITAYGVMALVEEGKLDLDAPVSTYLTRWQLPDSEFDNNGVTVRRLLSHTAGLTDGLGYLGFEPDSTIQTIEQALTTPNATSGPGVKIQVGNEPGSQFKYSGGGYLILQLLVEEVSQESFESFMQRAIFQPLKMTRSTFLINDTDKVPNLALSYNIEGTPATLYKFTAVGAASLYTTTSDMTKFIQAHLVPKSGSESAPAVLSLDTLKLMRQPLGYESGIELWGLGTILYTAVGEADFVAGHDGKNDPAINTTSRYNPATGDGFVMLETGNDLLATRLGAEWVFWQTGKIDVLSIAGAIDDIIRIIVPGWIVILIGALVAVWLLRRSGINSKTGPLSGRKRNLFSFG